MKSSVGEQLVSRILRQNYVSFEYDVELDDLKGVKNGSLRFDFIVSKGNKRVVIEYNGVFHYNVVKGKTTLHTLCKQQMNDLIKHEHCVRTNIPILWIPYWMRNDEIRKNVVFFLFKHNMLG